MALVKVYAKPCRFEPGVNRANICFLFTAPVIEELACEMRTTQDILDNMRSMADRLAPKFKGSFFVSHVLLDSRTGVVKNYHRIRHERIDFDRDTVSGDHDEIAG